LDSLDAELDGRLEFAFSEEFGYLTASPPGGHGSECHAPLHLPALALRGELPAPQRPGGPPARGCGAGWARGPCWSCATPAAGPQ
jgi:hypothetical protein